jgi:hypothetical protein
MYNETYYDEQHETSLWLVNGIVCSLSVEGVSYPTVEDVRNNWQFRFSDVTNEEIERIIDNVKRIDNFQVR